MTKNKTPKNADPGRPLSLRVRPETRDEIDKIAASTALSITDIANLALAAGLPMVTRKFKEMHEPESVAA